MFNLVWKDNIDAIVNAAKDKKAKKSSYDINRHLLKNINNELADTDYLAIIDNSVNRIQISIDDKEVYSINLA